MSKACRAHRRPRGRRAGIPTLLAVLVAGLVGLSATVSRAAATLDVGPGAADATAQLGPAQRAAAKALGAAARFVEEGRGAEARAALEQARSDARLRGYAELLQVRLLMAEGAHREAHQRASAALEQASSEALAAALGVVQGEALALAGDGEGAELAWRRVLEGAEGEDEAVRQSIELAIVSSRQRSGSLDPDASPIALLDRHYGDVPVATAEVPIDRLSADAVLDRAVAALDAGHLETARSLFDTAIARDLEPEQVRAARMGRARALFRSRHYVGAAEAWAALLPDEEARFWRARSLARSGRVEAALVEFEQVAAGGNAELASWALHLKGTLHEDRGEMSEAIEAYRRAATYEAFPERARQALWREGWAQFRTARFAPARATFEALAARIEDPVEALRPRYWAARAAERAGDAERARAELEAIARTYPLTYYGWRAQQRLGLDAAALVQSEASLAEGTQRVDDEAIERAALLVEAGLSDYARDELRFAARRARGFVDRTRVGVLLARVGDYHRANQLVVTAYADSLARGLQPGRESLWWLAWPPAHRSTIDAVFPGDAAIEPELVQAIMREESHYRVDARSAVGALGLLQLMPATAAELAADQGLEGFREEDLFDPRTNIALGAAYLDHLVRRFDGRLSAAIGSYNAGPSRVSSWLRGDARQLEDDVWVEDIPYDQTRSYVKRVLRSLHVYRTFYR